MKGGGRGGFAYVESVLQGLLPLVFCENGTAVQQNEERKVDGQPGLGVIGLYEALETPQHRRLERVQDLCRRHELNLRAHHGGDGHGVVVRLVLVESLSGHAKRFLAHDPLRLGFHADCHPELEDLLQKHNALSVLSSHTLATLSHAGRVKDRGECLTSGKSYGRNTRA